MATMPMPGMMPADADPKPPLPPMAGVGDERTPASPKLPDQQVAPPDAQPPQEDEPAVKLTDEQNKALIQIIRTYTEEYQPVRRKRQRQVLRARECFIGNQYISFDPQNFQWFDPLEAMLDGKAEDEDLSIYRYVNNVYQMLGLSFVAALCPRVPKARFMPVDADQLADCETAKVGSKIQDVVERQNRIKAMQKLELLNLWTDGVYFKYTRFKVDENRAGTRKTPIIGEGSHSEPDRFICPDCGDVTPASVAMGATSEPMCQGCGAQLSPSDFYPAETMPVPVVTSYREDPNGMVAMTCYSSLNITVAPYAKELTDCPILRLDEEMDDAAIKMSYPDNWDDIQGGTSGDSNADSERQARQFVQAAIGGRNNLTSQLMPTLSRTWLQPVAFAKHKDKTMAQQLMVLFPKGVKVVHVAELVLETKAEKMLDHWSWCPTIEGYGMYPPAVGDSALEIQDQINDLRNIIMEWVDRACLPQQYVNGTALDTRKINGKSNLPGSITEVKPKDAENMQALEAYFHQVKTELNDKVFGWANDLVQFAQLLSGVMPQVFGGSQPDVKTAQGQQQALNTAISRLSLFWEQIAEEHAGTAGKAVRIAGKNYTEDVKQVVEGGNQTYRNEYIYLDQLKGEFHAHAESDAGIPATFAEIRDRLERMVEAAGTNQGIGELLDDPTNQKITMDYLGAPGMIQPKQALRDKILQRIDQLIREAPAQQMAGDPTAPVTIEIPSVVPDPDFDCDEDKTFTTAKNTLRDWAVKNFRLELEQPAGWANIKAFFQMCVTMEEQNQAKAAMAAAAMGGGATGAGAGAPPGASAAGGQ